MRSMFVVDICEFEVELYFLQFLWFIILMFILFGLVLVGVYVVLFIIIVIFLLNLWLNSLILVVFVIGVLFCFGQVVQLVNLVCWIKKFVCDVEVGGVFVFLVLLVMLFRLCGVWMQLLNLLLCLIFDLVVICIDEDCDIICYLGNIFIFFGFLGIFWGLVMMVLVLVEIIWLLNLGEGESGVDVFFKFQQGLEFQFDGMGIVFLLLLFGFVGLLVVGLLELFVGYG